MPPSFWDFNLNIYQLVLLVCCAVFSGLAFYLIKTVKDRIGREESLVRGMVEEYQARIDRLTYMPVEKWDDPALLDACRGLVNSINRFREYQAGLEKLLNTEMDVLAKFLKEKKSTPNTKLTSDEKDALHYLLESIRNGLKTKSYEAYKAEEDIKTFLRRAKEERTKTGKVRKQA